MCGIGGILFSKSSGTALEHRVKKLAAAQAHRGPDEQQTVVVNNHAFCHQRLALLDKEGGKQPFYDSSGRYLIVYNGEIYNYEALRNALKEAYQFTSNSDTEVVLAAFIIWGESCLDKFVGMFSFLIWDTHRETAFGARDPLGVKPFVFHVADNVFIFASEVKAIVAGLDKSPNVNVNALVEYVVAPMLSGVDSTLLEGICFLGPGERLHISSQGIKRSIYHRFVIAPDSQGFEQKVQALRYELEESTRLSLKADVPVGSFFSGGLDSSILTALARKHRPTDHKAYTIRFRDHEQINFDRNTIVNSDDYPFAARLAADLDLDMQPVTAGTEQILAALQGLARINDRVPAWEQELSQHFLSQRASQDFKAVLVGDAADETNYGYFFLLNAQVNYGPLGLIRLFGGAQRCRFLAQDVQQSISPMEFLNEQYRELVQAEGFTFDGHEEDKVLAMSCLVYKRWLGRLLHNGDIHTMHFGLEARVPFANRNVLDVAGSIGPGMGFYQNSEKHMLKNAAKAWVPDYIVKRRKSALPRDPRSGPFYQKILHLLLREQKEFVGMYLHKKALQDLCEQQKLAETDRMILFNMISLLNWVQHYVR